MTPAGHRAPGWRGGLAAAGCGAGSGPALAFSAAPAMPVASPQEQISIRGADASELDDVPVPDRRSGRHAGRLVAYPEGVRANFLADEPFDPGERVEVTPHVNGDDSPIHSQFTVPRPVALAVEAGPPGQPARSEQAQSFTHDSTCTVEYHRLGTVE
jgi:hypothetical protein